MASLACRAHALSKSGAIAAVLVGATSAAAGWAWAVLLIGWFVASSALTRVGAAAKHARTAATLPATSARTATQVVANGGVYAIAALAATLSGTAWCSVAALGALAAAAADTWATEIGLLVGRAPRSIIGGGPMEPGLSGGVTWPGTIGGAAGALAVAGAAVALQLATPAVLMAITGAGIVGGLGDSLLGATVQAKRRCARCARWTERATHDCGVATEHGRGWRWMTNDTVNLCATFIGATAAIFFLIP
ncbi:DUF92 domain-containing protein [Pseudogemmatithrix spongiicola]|uniref:DUF92 domain-containing protein n=1 Tax=Pseudogemmatithrix spongiicola TaxID=3062599 RepID=A0AA49JWG8_9BACT|nr:DUF92 domain-containing protein [Gemmatimonadaceae bacterium 'strain 138']WKW15988.1 DUF92 domain-containing protein [Gemmatimonadaceae bacterium 'strain 318']